MSRSDSLLRDGLHEGAGTVAALVVMQLLDDDFRVLARQVGRARRRSCLARRGTCCTAGPRWWRRGRSRRLPPDASHGAGQHDLGRARASAWATCLAAVHSLGTPAARQMLSQRPLAVKSPCSEGSQTKPTSRVATVSPHQREHAPAKPARCSRCTGGVPASPAPDGNDGHRGALSASRAARSESRSSRP